MKSLRLSVLSVILASGLVQAAMYSLSDQWSGISILQAFSFENIPDPTHGRVNYVDSETARAKNLTYASDSTFVLQADSTTFLDPNGPGRDSVRLISSQTFTTHVAIFDVRHMPQGCGTWPAIWENGPNWPYGGEVDILEGVNDLAPNAVTLHTGPGCRMPRHRVMSGTATSWDCNALVNNNIGCSVRLPSQGTYGPMFNQNGGGWYVLERSSSYIRVWFWERNSPTVPDSVRHGTQGINTDEFGIPAADFPNTRCDMNEHFDEHNIIINLTFCGDWAGQPAIYNGASCPGSCVDHVNNNPEAFKEAFFDIASIRIYQ